jgi:hypothetical protein
MPFKSKHNKHKRSVSRKSRKLNKKTNSRTRSQKRSKRSKRSMRGGNVENAGCDYIKVEGMNLPGLVIENKMALIESGCKSTQPTLSAGEHPNMSK